MITDGFYTTLAGSFATRAPGFERLFMAVGIGLSQWDTTPPVYQRDVSALVNEVARKAISAEQIVFLDNNDHQVVESTARIALRTTFEDGEGEGPLRECGLFGGDVDGSSNSGILLSYFNHPRIDKTPGMSLQREVILNLLPTPQNYGQVVTRYLGNSNSQELHDLESETGACQLNEIRFDRRIYFASVEQATSLGYDPCAYCFGRELSNR